MKIINSLNEKAPFDIKQKLNGGQSGDTVCSEIYITPADDIAISFKGYVNGDEVEVKATNLDTYASVSSISTKGRYMILASNLEAVEIKSEATSDENTNIKFLF